MRTIVLILLLLAPALAAQDFTIEAQAGFTGGQGQALIAPPFTPLVVRIQRKDTRPLSGRVVVHLQGRNSRRAFAPDESTLELVQEVDLAEGADSASFTFEIPIFNSVMHGSAALELAQGETFEAVASHTFTAASSSTDHRELVAFVSLARMAEAKPFMAHRLAELSPFELPDNWKSLACFDAIVLNDDRLSRRQAEALVDYVVAGGKLILSPNSAAAFNPELPIARLIGASAGAPASGRLGDFDYLRGTLRPFEGSAPSQPVDEPDAGAALGLWTDAGRARGSDAARGLLSHTLCGAGSVVFVHTDLSTYPWCTLTTRAPTAPGITLLNAALNLAMPPATGKGLPVRRLASSDMRDQVDIAGSRIPHRDLQVLLIFLYVCAAGVGVFLLARKLKRPELYPAVLLGLALLSVALVFSLGQVFKRAGDRAKVVRLVVGDGSAGRNAVFTFGCAYVAGDTRVEFAHDRASWLVPALLDDGGWYGTLPELIDHKSTVSPVEVATSVGGLTTWQNLFFVSAGPTAPPDLKAALVGDGAGIIENGSPHRLSGCVVIVAKVGTPTTYEWHFLDSLDAAGGADSRAPLSQATRAPATTLELSRRIKDAAPGELAGKAMITLLDLPDADSVMLPDYTRIQGVLESAALLPAEGEYTMLCMLPDDAVSRGSTGLRGVEPDRIGQASLWAARGLVRTR